MAMQRREVLIQQRYPVEQGAGVERKVAQKLPTGGAGLRGWHFMVIVCYHRGILSVGTGCFAGEPVRGFGDGLAIVLPGHCYVWGCSSSRVRCGASRTLLRRAYRSASASASVP